MQVCNALRWRRGDAEERERKVKSVHVAEGPFSDRQTRGWRVSSKRLERDWQPEAKKNPVSHNVMTNQAEQKNRSDERIERGRNAWLRFERGWAQGW